MNIELLLIILILPPIITSVLKQGSLLTLASSFLAISVAVILATHSPLTGISFILPLVFFILFIRLALFRRRVIDYISEAENIKLNLNINNYDTLSYIKWTEDWGIKVAKDTKRNKGKAEADLFLNKGVDQGDFSMMAWEGTPNSEKRHYAYNIVIQRQRNLIKLESRL